MVSRVLIFGCSFSAGSYEYVPNAKSVSQSEVVLPESPGWYNYVDHLGDKELTVIATHGEGYWFWYQYINIILHNDLSNFDEIWFQESWEPRCSLVYPQQMELKYKYMVRTFLEDTHSRVKKRIISTDQTMRFSIDSWKVYPITSPQLWEENETANHTLSKRIKGLWPNDIFDLFTRSCANEIDSICKENKIKGYVWSINKPIMKCIHLNRLWGVDNVYSKFDLNKHVAVREVKVPAGHQYKSHSNVEGNKFIGKLINVEDFSRL